MNRRDFLALSGSSALCLGTIFNSSAAWSRPKTLQMPPLLDATKTGSFELQAQSGTTAFVDGAKVPTIGFNQPFLGPTIRVKEGAVGANVLNRLNEPITVHWHGLLVPGEADGGPHLPIATGERWSPELPINQAPATTWYHTHIHERTAVQVYAGLAGAMQITDGRDVERGLPSRYGVDDLMLLLQDRRFNETGQMVYIEHMMDVMHGFTGDTMLVNGQIGATAAVPKGIVRLRLLNGSNARIYKLSLSDDRGMHLIATDGGFIEKPVLLKELQLAPGERAEVLVDFTSGKSVRLTSTSDPNQGSGGMMGRFRRMLDLFGESEFTVLDFAVDDRMKAEFLTIPSDLGGEIPALDADEATMTRRFTLDTGMGMGMMGRGMMNGMMGGRRMGRGMMGVMSINGKPFDMNRINHRLKKDSTERWIVEADELVHPFHIHGAFFQVLKENGSSPRPEHIGWKDTVLVEEETELLVRFEKPAGLERPFMYHCHILEHEDAGMMGQFTVS